MLIVSFGLEIIIRVNVVCIWSDSYKGLNAFIKRDTSFKAQGQMM